MKKFRSLWLFLWLTLMVAGAPAWPALADTLARPSGTVVLEVTGAIDRTNAPGKAELDLAMLEAIDARTIETATRWTKGVRRFDGVGGKALVEALGAKGASVIATALNEYRIVIPIEDFTSDRLIIAYRLDGAPMSVREKGPLWIIYDFDSDADLNTEKYMARSVWQLRTLEFR